MADIDVLVAGAGAAGLASALSAAELGATVAIAEAHPTFRSDSNTAMSTSMIPAGGSRWQLDAGIDDSPDQFLADVAAKTGGLAHPTAARTLVDVAPRLVEWLADEIDVPIELVEDFTYPGHTVRRCHAVPDRTGRTLHAHLLRGADAAGVDLMVPMKLVDMSFDTTGTVDGAVLETPAGDREHVSAGAVILATNGFAANRSMVSEHIPEMADALYFGGHGSHGDAMTLGGRYGFDLAAMDAYQGHGSVASPHGVLVTWATVMHGAVIVDDHGRRFADETVGYSEFARWVLDREGSHAWLILDEAIHEACRVFGDYADLIDAGAVRWEDSPTSLAHRIGADVSVVESTLRTAHEAAVGSSADPLGRTDWGAPLDAPYGVVRITGALFHTQGGLDIDANARVLRGGEPVGGLYAAGGSAVGMSGRGSSGYLAGNGLLAALGLGYLGGRAAARDSSAREESS